MNFYENYFLPHGRINREQYWIASLKIIAVGIIAVMIMRFKVGPLSGIASILVLASTWSWIAIQAKRWHDRNKSGWWTLIVFIPYIGPVWLFIELGMLPGVHGKAYGNPGTPGGYGPHNETSLPPQYIHLIAMFAKLAKSDGAVTKDEINVMDTFFTQVLSLSNELRDAAIQTFRISKDSNYTFEEHTRQFYSLSNHNPTMLAQTVDLLFELAVADGHLSSEEEMLINEAMAIFGVESPKYNNFKSSRNPRQERSAGEDTYYANILGLSGETSKAEIRKAYRHLVTQYHPDKVTHMGDRIREVAEEEMKKINEAYSYFRKKHGL